MNKTRLFFSVLGLLLVLEGLPYFAFPDRLKDWMAKVCQVDSRTLRVLGFLAMMSGLVIVYVTCSL